MKSPLFTREQCIGLLSQYNVIPIAQSFSLNFDTSLSVYLKTNSEFLLESAESGESMGRYSFVGKGIRRKFVLHPNKIEDWNNKGNYVCKENLHNPLEYVQELMKSYKAPHGEVYTYPPFWGGLLGYLGYETVGFYENIEDLQSKEGIDVPEGILIIPEQLLVIDHLTRMLWIICIIENIEHYESTLSHIQNTWDTITNPLPEEYQIYNKYSNVATDEHTLEEMDIQWSQNMSKEQFLEKLCYCKECIYKGDIIQVVFSRRLSASFPQDNELLLYIHLRNVNPSPYMYYLKFDTFSIIGSSPEVMSSLDLDGTMRVKPIAGTIKRGNTQAEDFELKQALLQDEKERAEHIMLVDLARNDLHKIAKPRTVAVPQYMQVDGYSHVYHIVSVVEGKIQEQYDGFDLINATFPAGTLSGAPKIEAMNIIGRTEPTKRNIYAGLVMVMGFNGYLDSCIAIRTAVLQHNTIYIQAGAGIVADSDPEKEWEETNIKLGAVIRAVKEVLSKRITDYT